MAVRKKGQGRKGKAAEPKPGGTLLRAPETQADTEELTIQIESDVPMPAVRRSGKESQYPFAQMDVGDSFAMPIDFMGKLRGASQHYRKRNPEQRFSIRAEDGETCRCWRVEDKDPESE
jgi:hypothetical protein